MKKILVHLIITLSCLGIFACAQNNSEPTAEKAVVKVEEAGKEEQTPAVKKIEEKSVVKNDKKEPKPMTEIDKKVSDLLAKMDLDQKIGQMVQPERQAATPEDVKQYHIGSILSGGGSIPGNNTLKDWVMMNDAYWEASMDSSGNFLPIPIIYGIDAVHGHNNVKGATIFPHNIGLGATNDPELIKRIAAVTAKEVAATGLDWTFAPCVTVVRNDRWGRTYEGYSEDPKIVADFAGPFVEGLQGDFGDANVVASVKHWIGDGGTTHGIDRGNTQISEEELRKIHMPGYVSAIKAGAQTIMASYNSWNGVKLHGHKYLITDLLKDELGFDGFVVSDWDAIDEITGPYVDDITNSVNAGVDMFMVPHKWKQFLILLKENIYNGKISMERIDDAVTRILKVKFRAGLFDKPRPKDRPLAMDSSFGSKEHREVAREAVRKSLVLLKNESNILPLDKNQRILVTGKNANDLGHQSGGWTITWQGKSGIDHIGGGTTVLQGIQNIASEVTFLPDPSVAEPDDFDVAIVVIGEKPYAEGFGDVREDGKYGKNLDLGELHPEDYEIIQSLAIKGIPVVTILISARPLVTTEEINASDAFIAAWLPGSEGQGIADVIFGDFDFTGKLSFSWPAEVGQIMNVGDDNYQPMFAYGYGLTYQDKQPLTVSIPGTVKFDQKTSVFVKLEQKYNITINLEPGGSGVFDLILGDELIARSIDANKASTTVEEVQLYTGRYSPLSVEFYDGEGVIKDVSFEAIIDEGEPIFAIDKIEAENYSRAKGTKIENEGKTVGYLDEGTWLRYANVDFGTGVDTFTASLALDPGFAEDNKKFELRLDKTDGALIGALASKPSNGWADFVEHTIDVNSKIAQGIHNLFIIPIGGNGVGNLDYFSFGLKGNPITLDIFSGKETRWKMGIWEAKKGTISTSPATDKNGAEKMAKEIFFNGKGPGVLYFQKAGTEDLSKYTRGGFLKFDMKILSDKDDTGKVIAGIHCVYPCKGEIDITKDLPLQNEWKEMRYPLKTFQEAGTNIKKVNTPFLIYNEAKLKVVIANVRWEAVEK